MVVLFLNDDDRVLCAASVVIWKFPAFLDNVVSPSHRNIRHKIWPECRKLQALDLKSGLDFTFIMVSHIFPCIDIYSLHSRGQQGPNFLPVLIFVRNGRSWHWRVEHEAVDCNYSVSSTYITFNSALNLTGTLLFYSLASGGQIPKVTLSLSIYAYLIQ